MVKSCFNAMLARCVIVGLFSCFSMLSVVATEDTEFSLAPVNPAFLRWVERQGKSSQGQDAVRTLSVSVDASVEERQPSFGLIPEPFDTSYLSKLKKSGSSGGAVRALSALPSRYDLREQGILTPIKAQQPYGTCWAHAACGVLESSLLKAGVGTYDFSENNMVNLHGFDWDFNTGGNAGMASAYLLRWSGPVLESQDRYPNVGGSVSLSPARHVQNIRWIPGRTSYTDNDHIKQAVLDYGAIYVEYHHDDMYLASDGKSYCFDSSSTKDINHAVAIVGWDDNYPASKFRNVPAGNGAFIMRNSWGTGSGENGYLYVSYYDKIFGWHTMRAFLPPEEADNYDSIYQYDPLGMIGSTGLGNATTWGANIFEARKTESIVAIGFYAVVPNTSYTIYVYSGCNPGNPRSGALCCSQDGQDDPKQRGV